ncbi:MAG TPA: hypothetical protein VJ779_19790 [Acetobacteraceae bacterium]|nr:hypothetical protein [Acetobacteraceae bacterium]
MTRRLSPRAYLAIAALAGGCVLALAWTWVALMPLAFFDPEYAAWAAKMDMLARCDLGEVMVVGDSRAAAGIVPALMPRATSNLAMGGGKAIEALSVVRRALACPNPPRRVVISLSPAQFTRPDLFWERTVRYGLLSASELAELERTSRDAGDWSVFEDGHGDGLTGKVRAALYEIRFPALYFGSLTKGGVFLRLRGNRRALAAGLLSRGQYFFGTEPGCDAVAVEGHLPAFRPLPVLDRYFDRLLALLAARHVRTEFVAIPINQETWRATQPAMRSTFASYLHAYEVKYPNFRIVGPVLLSWPDRFFGDAFSHLNPAGARLLSARLAACLDGVPGACALDWTAVAAQTAPRSKEQDAWPWFPPSRFPASITAASATSSSPP